MTQFFSYFPKIRYDINQTNQFEVVTNVFFRLKFIEKAKNDANLYFEYLVRDGETPETIAERYYGSAEAHWIILMMNDILDAAYDWPLTYRNFNEYIISKYGSISNSTSSIHHSEIVTKRTDATGNDTEVLLQIDSECPNANISSSIPYYAWDFGSLPTSEPAGIVYTLPSGETVRERIWKRQVTNYDWEVALNDRKRTIKLLTKAYYGQVMQEFAAFVSENNPQARVGLRSARV